MIGVLEGFGVIFAVILVGWVLGRTGALGEQAQSVISRLVFFVATPALLFETLQSARLDQVFNATLLVQVGSAAITLTTYLVIVRLWWKPSAPEALIGGMASSYVNGGNLGIPLAVYVFGSATYVAPVMLFQIAFYAPLAMAAMDALTGGSSTLGQRIARPLLNPMVVASAVGVAFSLLGVQLPEPAMQPISLIADLSVPGALIAFGLSLAHIGSFTGEPGRHDVAVIVPLKLLFQPAVALALAVLLFHLDGMALYSTVAIAALPTAQNILTYATRYARGRIIARDAILITTLLSLPVLLLITALYSP